MLPGLVVGHVFCHTGKGSIYRSLLQQCPSNVIVFEAWSAMMCRMLPMHSEHMWQTLVQGRTADGADIQISGTMCHYVYYAIDINGPSESFKAVFELPCVCVTGPRVV